MEQQIDRPFIKYGLAEVQYDIKANSKLTDTAATKTVIDITQAIIEAHKDDCALNIKIEWTLNE